MLQINTDARATRELSRPLAMHSSNGTATTMTLHSPTPDKTEGCACWPLDDVEANNLPAFVRKPHANADAGVLPRPLYLHARNTVCSGCVPVSHPQTTPKRMSCVRQYIYLVRSSATVTHYNKMKIVASIAYSEYYIHIGT